MNLIAPDETDDITLEWIDKQTDELVSIIQGKKVVNVNKLFDSVSSPANNTAKTVNVKALFDSLSEDKGDTVGARPKKGEFYNYKSEDDDTIINTLLQHETGGVKGDKYSAKNKNSSAYGKFQITQATYKWVAKETGKSLDYLKTPTGQEFAFHEFLYPKYKKSLKKLGLPINSANIYTIHQLGLGRSKRYFSGTLNSKDYKVMWQNLPSNIKHAVPSSDKDKILKHWTRLYRQSK